MHLHQANGLNFTSIYGWRHLQYYGGIITSNKSCTYCFLQFWINYQIWIIVNFGDTTLQHINYLKLFFSWGKAYLDFKAYKVALHNEGWEWFWLLYVETKVEQIFTNVPTNFRRSWIPSGYSHSHLITHGNLNMTLWLHDWKHWASVCCHFLLLFRI